MTDTPTCFTPSAKTAKAAKDTRGEATVLSNAVGRGEEIFSGDWPLSRRQLEAVLAQIKESPLAGDVRTAQLQGFGPDDFLVLHEEQKHFQIVAEFKAASGSFRTRAYMANAINTWPKLAEEVLELRKRLSERGEK